MRGSGPRWKGWQLNGIPTCRSRASSAKQIQVSKVRRDSWRGVTRGRVRGSSGRSAGSRKELPPAATPSFVVRIDKEREQLKPRKGEAQQVTCSSRTRTGGRRGFASDFITRNVAATVSCSCSWILPLSPYGQFNHYCLRTQKISAFSRPFHIAGLRVEDYLQASASFPVLTYPIPGSSTQTCLPRLQESRQYFLVWVKFGSTR